MAIKDQCLQCRFFNEATGMCGKTGVAPLLNYSSCEMYQKKGISLEKPSSHPAANSINPIIPPTPQPNNPRSRNPQPTGSKGMFAHVFSFEGRIRRLEYGLTFLIYFLLFYLPMELISEDDLCAGFTIVWLLLFIPVLWILYAQGAKRCHDIGHSGWWQLIPFYVFWMIFQEGEPGTNQYGDNPKD